MRAGAGRTRRRRVKRLRKRTEGYWGAKKKHLRRMKEAVLRAGERAFIDRKRRKRDIRRLWILRINAAARQHGLKYSEFIAALKRADVKMNRKTLAELAFSDAEGFTRLIETVKADYAHAEK